MDDMMARIITAVLPGGHLVEAFPILDFLPDVVAKWRREAKEDFRRFTAKFEQLYFRIKNNHASSSLCANLVDNETHHGMSDIESAWVAGALYGAGQETSTSTLQWFLYSMLLFPETQTRAQEELDRVVGRSRPPSFPDIKHLPYIQALVKEVLRWKPPAPLGIPHAVTEDDYYDGYFIPKGSVIFANVLSLNRDPEIYGPDAAQFRPDRHLNEKGFLKNANDDGHFTFGFGHRQCVGRHFADNFLSIAFATILWAIRIEPITDAFGNVILPDTTEGSEMAKNLVM
ncbi:cytochrome P450 [Dendrothele bispora CBS 962.96]|uniref:Cytochrome P450 n=1 Tax=Dendrothele bispora (strain CBS 962.96) TaxID=1314807 RepID=A0A4S8MH31_DENBC|nr:cytochrome P450 [Dendrothele bispora CBS 962.96]